MSCYITEAYIEELSKGFVRNIIKRSKDKHLRSANALKGELKRGMSPEEFNNRYSKLMDKGRRINRFESRANEYIANKNPIRRLASNAVKRVKGLANNVSGRLSSQPVPRFRPATVV